MSELIDRNVLKAKMYQEAFESDTDMQKWDGGCWIRYKLFEKVVDSTPTVPYGPRWHRVEDGLPEIGKAVVVSIYGDMRVATRLDDKRFNGRMYWELSDGSWERVENDMYWMPIEPPKEDA